MFHCISMLSVLVHILWCLFHSLRTLQRLLKSWVCKYFVYLLAFSLYNCNFPLIKAKKRHLESVSKQGWIPISTYFPTRDSWYTDKISPSLRWSRFAMALNILGCHLLGKTSYTRLSLAYLNFTINIYNVIAIIVFLQPTYRYFQIFVKTNF